MRSKPWISARVRIYILVGARGYGTGRDEGENAGSLAIDGVCFYILSLSFTEAMGLAGICTPPKWSNAESGMSPPEIPDPKPAESSLVRAFIISPPSSGRRPPPPPVEPLSGSSTTLSCQTDGNTTCRWVKAQTPIAYASR